jgi:hypothetical protein
LLHERKWSKRYIHFTYIHTKSLRRVGEYSSEAKHLPNNHKALGSVLCILLPKKGLRTYKTIPTAHGRGALKALMYLGRLLLTVSHSFGSLSGVGKPSLHTIINLRSKPTTDFLGQVQKHNHNHLKQIVPFHDLIPPSN